MHGGPPATPQRRPRPRSLTIAQRAFVVSLAAYRVLLLLGIACAFGPHAIAPFLSARLLTYLALMIETVTIFVGAIGAFFEPVLRFYLLFLLPLAAELAISVSFLICAVVWANDRIYTRHLGCVNGTVMLPANHSSDMVEFSRVHTQDFFVHNWPVIEQFMLVIVTYVVAHYYTRLYVAQSSRLKRVLYALYLVFAGAIVVAIYGLISGWKHTYGLSDNAVVGNTLAIGICIAIGLFYAWNAWPSEPGSAHADTLVRRDEREHGREQHIVLVAATPTRRRGAGAAAGPSVVSAVAIVRGASRGKEWDDANLDEVNLSV